MKRKVAKGGRLRLSPNEEALLLKEEYERRRRLRLQQVREQERHIALQIRQEVKQRRDEQLHQLAEELKAEWWKAQNQKIKALEKLYLSSLRAVGEGHRQAKENEPDLVALAKQAEERKQRAEKRHKEALKQQKTQKEKLLKEQTWRTNARKHALYMEKERAAKIASLPPPPPHPFEDFEVKRVPTVKVYNADSFSVTHHHLFEPYVDREMDTTQPDARLVAEEKAKRLDELQKEEERDRREQLEKAHLRGSRALKMVHLVQERERLMKELELRQNMDLARRRQIVAKMPPQLFEPAYRRMEIKEDWQRELEFAFEDMYTGDRKMKGDMILHLEPQPLPIPSDRSQDEDLNISLEPDSVCETQSKLDEVAEKEDQHSSELKNHEVGMATQTQSKLVLKKLLNKIRSQKDQWTSKCEAEVQSEIETIESGTLASEERRLGDSEPGHEQRADSVSRDVESPETKHTVIAGNSVLIRPQEQATRIRMEVERQKQIEQIEQQKQKQLTLLKQIEEKRIRLEAEFLKVQMQAQQEEIKKKEQEAIAQDSQLSSDPLVNQHRQVEHKTETAVVPETSSFKEENHIQMIRNYQQCLLQQNRLHKQSVEEARKQLQEYQNKLKQRYPSISMPLSSAVTLQSRFVNLKPTTCESVLQMHGRAVLHKDHPSASQSSVQVQVQEHAQPLTTHSRTHFVLEKPFEQRDDEQRHIVGSTGQLQSIDVCQLDQGQFQLPQQSYPSQEQMEMLGTSNNQMREWSESQELPGSVMMTSQDTSVLMQTEAQIKQVTSALPTEEPSEPSGTLDLDKKSVMSQKMLNPLRERETQKQSHLTTLDMPAAEGSPIAQAASFDSSEYQQVPAKSSIKTTFEQSIPQFFQHLTSLSPDESETGASQESFAPRSGGASLLNYSNILKLRAKVLASSESIQAQQDHLKELQEQLDVQRDALLSRQRLQEELLLHKQAKLKEQMQRQQEALQDFLSKRTEESVTYRKMTETQNSDHFRLTTYPFKDAESKSQEVNCCDVNNYVENRLLSQSIYQAEQIEESQRILRREQRWLTSKPPPAKIKLGLDLEQHELSVIPELDTPKSGKISFTDKTDSVGEEASLISSVEELVSGVCNNESVHEERDLPITNCKEQGSNDNPKYSIGLINSWHEGLMVDAGNSHGPAIPKESVVMSQDLPVYAADAGRGIITDSGPSCRPDSTVALSKGWSTSFALQEREAVVDYLSSTTISSGSFLPSEKLDLSPANTGLSSSSAEDRILRETASSPWDSSASTPTTAQQRHETSSEVSEFHLSAEENFISNRSQIQQIIDKYTKDWNWLPENSTSFHAPSVGLSFSDMERHFPNFQRQLFQPLEPSPDYDTTSSLFQHRISQDSKDLSKSLAISTQSQDTPEFPQAATSSLKTRSYNLHSCLNRNKLNNTTSQAEESIKENVTLAGSEEPFHPLHLESTLNEHSQSTEQPTGLCIVSEQNSKIKKSENGNYISLVGDQYEELVRNIENTNLQSSVENLQSPTSSSLAEQDSFHQLITTQTTENETLLTEHSVKEVVELREKNLCFEELPVVSSTKHTKLTETPVLRNEANRIVEGDHSQCSINILNEEQSILEVQISSRMPTEMKSEILASPSQAVVLQNDCLPETPQNQNSNSVIAVSSGSHTSQSRVPVWETESGQGIMEEPELTLLSSNDVSIAESDCEHISQEKKRKNKLDSKAYSGQTELKSCSEGREFLPLNPEADYSVSMLPDCSAIAQTPNEDQSLLHQSAVMLLEFTSAPCTLQESFLKRKKNFIQKSSKRVEEIKNRERNSEKPQAMLFQREKAKRFHMLKEHSPTSGTVVNQLKKVGEVKVCSPEEKRSDDVEMQQRTLRLYNQLAEVKSRKEEKSRQETYAKNREKAKEFQKKTLEKLRAKKTH